MNHKAHFSHTSLQSPAAFNRPSACGNAVSIWKRLQPFIITSTNSNFAN